MRVDIPVMNAAAEDLKALEVNMHRKHILTLTVNPALDKSTAIGRVVPEHGPYCRNPVYETGDGGINVSRRNRGVTDTRQMPECI